MIIMPLGVQRILPNLRSDGFRFRFLPVEEGLKHGLEQGFLGSRGIGVSIRSFEEMII